MKEEIHKTLSKMQSDTPKASSPNSSSGINVTKPLGDPDCPHCGGAGYVRFDVPMGDPKFGRLESCVCRASAIAAGAPLPAIVTSPSTKSVGSEGSGSGSHRIWFGGAAGGRTAGEWRDGIDLSAIPMPVQASGPVLELRGG